MSEECSDYVDIMTLWPKIVRGGTLNFSLTTHSIKRLSERKLRRYKKEGVSVISNTIMNVLRDGKYKVLADKVLVWTRSYTLVCTLDRHRKLVVKTVLSTRGLEGKVRNLLHGGRRVKWKSIIPS